jgi:hypothetical protein
MELPPRFTTDHSLTSIMFTFLFLFCFITCCRVKLAQLSGLKKLKLSLSSKKKKKKMLKLSLSLESLYYSLQYQWPKSFYKYNTTPFTTHSCFTTLSLLFIFLSQPTPSSISAKPRGGFHSRPSLLIKFHTFFPHKTQILAQY